MRDGALVLAAVMTDEGYRAANRAMPGRLIPRAIWCPDCGSRSDFKDDRMAARYECKCGHAVAAMHADWCVAGTRAERPWPGY